MNFSFRPFFLVWFAGATPDCKKKDLRDKIPKKFPHKFSLLVGSKLFSGTAGLTWQLHPPQTLQILGVAGRHAAMPML